MNASEDFRRFHDSFFGSRGYGWEPDITALLRLEDDERARAESLLISALKQGDSEAATGLGEMRSHNAVESLKSALGTANGDLRIQAALALWKIERFPEAAAIISAGLGTSRPALPVDDPEIDEMLVEFDHVSAVVALGEIATPESAAALVKALSHPRDLVRYNAATALGRICGQAREISQFQTALMSNQKEEAAAARRQILELVDAHNIADIGQGKFEIHFDWTTHEYLVYEEAGRMFHFHPDYSRFPIVVPTGDYLSGMLGRPCPFETGERDRIVPRLEQFLRRERNRFIISPASHRPEPEELVPAIGGKIRLKTMPAMQHAPEVAGAEQAPTWRRVAIVLVGVSLGGGAGFIIGRFLELVVDMPSPTAWIAMLVGAVLGGTFAWLSVRGE
jgi:hypothetical protein